MNRRTFFQAALAALAGAAFLPCAIHAADAPGTPAEKQRLFKDVAYAGNGHELQRLDIYLPRDSGPHPLIVWVHGGAWRAGTKQDMPLGGLIARGFAVASVDYRLSTVAPFPAQMHDIKAAIRFLRAHAAEYDLDAKRFAVAGGSAGGHLAALTGASNGNAAVTQTSFSLSARPSIAAPRIIITDSKPTSRRPISSRHGPQVLSWLQPARPTL